MEFIRITSAENFHKLVLSLKSSNSIIMVEAIKLLVEMMQAEGYSYPLHLGVTEAGEGEDGRIRSAIGIGALLSEGIGDTIRVSLSEPPENEIPVARMIVESAKRHTNGINPGDATIYSLSGVKTLKLTYSFDDPVKLSVTSAVDSSAILISRKAEDLIISNSGNIGSDEIKSIKDGILQAARIKITRNDYISCPTCGRTKFDLSSAVIKVKAATAHLKGLKIAIMGCIVNGPGEMADADYGYVGSGKGTVHLYRGKEAVLKNIPEADAVKELLKLINKDLKNSNKN
jgi:(E)-4-hydroxy-3-methylbut-2-enyl-diphosphate synthase